MVVCLSLIRFSYCIINITNVNLGGSYIGSPGWIKNKAKTKTINPINIIDDKCF